MTINKFIKQLQSISSGKRDLPLIIQCPNGLEVDPKIKMKFKDNWSAFSDNELEAMIITY